MKESFKLKRMSKKLNTNAPPPPKKKKKKKKNQQKKKKKKQKNTNTKTGQVLKSHAGFSTKKKKQHKQ